jgi:bacterioferritin-associated ferredoxin
MFFFCNCSTTSLNGGGPVAAFRPEENPANSGAVERRFASIRRMIVCSCNVLSDHEVRAAVSRTTPPQTTRQVYGCLGCSVQCGRCARTIRRIMDEALKACPTGCACSRHDAESG